MKKIYKLAHISDLHIPYKDRRGFTKRFEDLMQNIQKQNADHLAITGDIIDNACTEDYNRVKKILMKYDFYHPDMLTITIGNHEIFGSPSQHEVYMFPYICKKTNYGEKIRQFYMVFKDIMKSAVFPIKNNIFPFYKIVSGKIALIGINSVSRFSLKYNPKGSNGYIEKMNYKNIITVLKLNKLKDYVKVILIHHYFNKEKINKNIIQSLWLASEKQTMKLHNKKILQKAFEKYKIPLVLHGHSHITETYMQNRIKYVNSSGALYPFTESKERSYNLITFSFDKNEKERIKTEKVEI